MRGLLATLLLLIAGCTSGGAEQELSADESTMFCTKEKELGSHISKTRCRTMRQIEAERHSSNETLRRSAVNVPDASMQQFAQ